MTRHIPKEQLDSWLMQLIQGDISQEDLVRLEGAMADDLEILDYCMDYLVVTSGLEWLGREMETHGAEHLMQSLRKGRRLSPRRSRGTLGFRIVRTVTRIAAVLLLGLGIAYAVIRFMPQAPRTEVARIHSSHGAKWEQTTLGTAAGTVLTEGTRHLQEGLVDLELSDGTRLVVKGPCRFHLPAQNSIDLHRGMVTARVPSGARGFTVHTDAVSIVDHGTEFGVIAKADGTVETHVFEGQVTLVPPGETVNSQGSIPLPAGVAAAVHPDKPIQKSGANAVRFVREVPNRATGALAGKRFDLADVVGRGNGFGTGKIGWGLHPANGEALEQPVPRMSIAAQGGYGFLLSWRYIDGVFVPDGHRGPNAVTSTGRLFQACPDTNGRAALGITNGGFMALPGQRQAAHAPMIGGQRYGTVEKPTLGMHPNAGITFDLDRIRADNPGTAIAAFQALGAISETAPQFPEEEVTFWVLVDGEVRFQHVMSQRSSQAATIRVALSDSARFLTLVTTCPGNTDYAWAVWALPFLELRESL
jgi:hypothetical protein